MFSAAPKNSSARQVSDASGDSSSEDSEEIIVYETPENQSYERKVVIGHLSRVGFREPFWRDKVAAFFVILSYLITYDIVAHFFLFTHVFGISWTFTYGFCMLFIGFPMCYLEMALGQYTSTGVFMVFDRITPAFVGVGISALLINFFAASMDQGLFVNALSIIRETVQILTSEMPWHHCLSTHGMKYCHVWSRECSRLTKQIAIPQYPRRLIYKGGKEFEFVLKGDTCVRPPLRSLYTGLNDIAPKTELDKFKTASMGDPNKMDTAARLRKQGTYHNPATIATILLNANHIFGEYEPIVTFWYSIIMISTVISSKDGYIRAASINFTVIPIASSVVVLCELFVVGIFYGFRVFYSNTSLMIFGAAKTEAKKLKLLVNSMALVLWTVVIPVAILFSIVALIIYDARSDFTALDIYNWILLSAILLPIPAMCIYLNHSEVDGNKFGTEVIVNYVQM
ncbi:hypothetical protein NECAME_12244 [Necator americanus]|uniref:Sodium:neurotransmitter symporter family protein n=1 Tax=Necator americanus TaxID=51031 RepID=W2T3R8_NECAM|nr:hypothetical protein NECAME_12244 [Necator americanus]ETN75622.1 hypothetical protein NECAME_12244 [Necator americanus]